jgi:predicted secreted protein
MEVVEGDEFEVSLADLPGAGYGWTTEPVPDGITLVSSDWSAPASALAGAARSRAFRFRADRAGDYALQFALVRAWEPRETVPPAEERSVSVAVRPR